MDVKVFDLLVPTEEKRYIFALQFEDDRNVFFHMTLEKNKESILANGFKSASELGTGVLESVSYANRSNICFANFKPNLDSKYVIFVVRFTDQELTEIAINPSDIHVYKKYLQPEIIGFGYIPVGFRLP